MRVIIGGGGRVGTGLARALRSEDKDVVLVDNNARAVKILKEWIFLFFMETLHNDKSSSRLVLKPPKFMWLRLTRMRETSCLVH